MCKYSKSKNAIVSVFLDPTGPTNFYYKMPPLDFVPDICIVRNLTYVSDRVNSIRILNIWSSIGNSFIGSVADFCGTNAVNGITPYQFVSEPMTTIKIHEPFESQIKFQIFTTQTAASITLNQVIPDLIPFPQNYNINNLSITLSFLKYAD